MKIKRDKNGMLIDELGEPVLLSGRGVPLGMSDTVFCVWKGKQYVRRYVKPQNPRTPKQMAQRKRMGAVVKMWRTLPPKVKAEYNRRAEELGTCSGFNLFVSENASGSPLPE